MSEKVRALNLTSGNVHHSSSAATTAATTTPLGLTASTTTTSAIGGGCALIGAPTLISSTFNSNTTALPTPGAGNSNMTAAETTSTAAQDTQDAQSEFAAAAATVAHSAIQAQLNFHLLPAASDGGDANSIMNSSQISTTSNDSALLPFTGAGGAINGHHQPMGKVTAGGNGGRHLTAQSVAGKTCRFPKLEECAHFHYERVQLGPLSVRLVDDKSELLNSSIASQSLGGDIDSSGQLFISGSGIGGGSILNVASSTGPSSFRSFSPSNCWFIIKVFPSRCDPFLVKRSFDNMQMLDEMLHRCVYDRKISGLRNLHELDYKTEEEVEYAVAKYLERFSKIASDSLTCGTILTWLQLDNKGRRLPLADGDTMRSINTPAVGAAYGVRRYQAQAPDEISIEVGDMISVIDMPSPAESSWWRGKKSHQQKSHYEVGFFPQSCVATIGDKVPRNFRMPAPLVGQLDVSPTKPVLRKHGKLIAFFRSFILSRPSRRRLKQSGIYRERVFSCDLSEHLLNSGQDIPMVLSCCADFIERYGIIDGIYRLSGITSNIQKLRRAFDEERVPDLGNPEMKQDIHAVSSLLKMYFRELPNPLCTYQLYDNFVKAIQEKNESTERLRLMKDTVLKLPPPHYRTLKYLAEHLNKISQHAARTGMTDKNLAIVWAPNLLRSPALEAGGVAALRGVGVQAVVTEYLIRNCHNIFDALEDPNVRFSYIATAAAQPLPVVAPAIEATRLDSLTDCESLLVEQREHDQSLTNFAERPKSLSAGGPKLISLEEAQERHSRLDGFDIKQSMPINMLASTNAANISSYIEVGGGPSSLPDKYHTVLSAPRSWQKRKTHSWKSLFTRNAQRAAAGGPLTSQDLKMAASVDETEGHHLMTHSQRKEAAQVTFAEADSIIGGPVVKGGKAHKPEKTKSIEMFETSNGRVDLSGGKPMEVCCVRSNSIDSLRTAGHSRSVSHDSYFDLLQSPQRGHVTTCPSRELSELGLNFDREEPEMRIFSESESLVSSPRVGKENIPPPSSGAATRRIMRARPEDFSSQTNSVNPSPKKQPRLNLLLSSTVPPPAEQRWSQASSTADGGPDATTCQEHAQHSSGDESCCKRYKLEDQLSDIQFIDCSTPEHTVAHSLPPTAGTTLYTSVQVHAPPKSALSQSSLYGSTESAGKLQEVAPALPNTKQPVCEQPGTGNMRYSYPTVQLGAKRKEQENVACKERFSYPGMTATALLAHQQKEAQKMHMEEAPMQAQAVVNRKASAYNRAVSFSGAPTINKSYQQAPKVLPDLLRPKNRSSYCGGPQNEQLNMLLLRGSNSDLVKGAGGGGNTPNSPPVHSPRYSLLVGGDDTSSENSSAIMTPQYELDPLMVSSNMSGLSGTSSQQNQQQQQMLLSVDGSYLGTSRESLGSNLTASQTHSHNQGALTTPEKRDMQALKRELSLDLQPVTSGHSSRMSVDHPDAVLPTAALSLHGSLKLGHAGLLSSPNNSNFTDNTSQSVTPSEYGYQHLQRPSSMHSLIETATTNTTENSPGIYEDYEQTPSNLVSPLGAGSGAKQASSPIKATISITYNLKSPTGEAPTTPTKPAATLRQKTKPLLETSFDENTVYEQVKFFRNSVTEVNQLLNEERRSLEESLTAVAEEFVEGRADDIQMQADSDSLEEERLLYENVELRKPKSVYANMLGEDMKSQKLPPPLIIEDNLLPDKLVELGATDLVPTLQLEKSEKPQIDEEFVGCAARRSPSNFSVKELANKFECSPVEQLPAFDFSMRSSIKKQTPHNYGVSAATAPEPKVGSALVEQKSLAVKQLQQQQQLNKQQQQITRSLDENAFVREFGGTRQLQELHVARSTQQLPDLNGVGGGANSRRKSFDFTRPKTLNPPKRLPGMAIAEEFCQQRGVDTKCHTNNKAASHQLTMQEPHSSLEHDCETIELKITPTTENRLALIQHNVALPGMPSGIADVCNSNVAGSNSNSLKMLSGVKLDRERIDRIKEERRQQLTQKYRGAGSNTDCNAAVAAVAAMKSKSKTDLLLGTSKGDDDEATSIEGVGSGLRVKSKSRADMRTLPKDNNELNILKMEFGRAGSVASGINATLGGAELPSNYASPTTRVRSISDEKNQNNCDVVANGATNNSNTTTTTVSNNLSSLERQQQQLTARATAQKFERNFAANGAGIVGGVGGTSVTRRSMGAAAATGGGVSAAETNAHSQNVRHSANATREKISPQFSIRNMAAMFESRSQNQQ